MIQELADILRQKIADSGMVELAGGLAQPWPNAAGKGTKPVFWDYTRQEHVSLVPDAELWALTYFEDAGTAITADRMGRYRTELRLIGWVNTAKAIATDAGLPAALPYALGGEATYINTPRFMQQLQELFKLAFNAGIYTGVRVTFTGLLPEGPGLFAGYSYDAKVKKYLHKPYDAFGLRLVVSFNVAAAC